MIPILINLNEKLIVKKPSNFQELSSKQQNEIKSLFMLLFLPIYLINGYINWINKNFCLLLSLSFSAETKKKFWVTDFFNCSFF